jgi:hypothetical protein
MYVKKQEKIKKNIQVYKIYNSFIDKSNGIALRFLLFIPNVILNHDLQKPIKPITFAMKSSIQQDNGAVSNNPEKI